MNGGNGPELEHILCRPYTPIPYTPILRKRKQESVKSQKKALFGPKKALIMNFKCKFTYIPMIILKYSLVIISVFFYHIQIYMWTVVYIKRYIFIQSLFLYIVIIFKDTCGQ